MDGINANSFVRFYTADNNPNGGVATTDVRSGVSYGGGLVGTCAVPNPGTVAFGVAVDNTTGTATLTAANLRAALGMASANLDTQLAVLSNLDTTVSSRLAPSGTLARVTLTDTATTLTNAPASVTPAQIRAEMDTNSTKLANLDATISSRLAGSAYTAPTTPPTAAEIATAVEGSLLNEADGQAVLNAIVGAIGNTNVSEVSLVAAIRSDIERTGGKLDNVPTAAANASAVWGTATKQITGGTVDTLTNSPSVPSAASIASATRTELAVELARVDAAVSSRMAASEATKLDAVKVKTDALPIERLQNCATTAIVGNLIAQANS